jgi:DNA-directed RNA polymerase subunit E'/Rpb7
MHVFRSRVQVQRTEKVTLHPQHFGGDVKNKVVAELKKNVEGRINPKWGYTVIVVCPVFIQESY